MLEHEAELDIENVFKMEKKKLVKQLGRKGLWNTMIDKVGDQLLGNKWGGCYPQDTCPLKQNTYYIVNTDTHLQKGKHWCAIVCKANTCYCYDSFARDPNQLLKFISRKAKKYKFKIVSSDRSDSEQYNGELCGHNSLAFLICVHKYGIRKALLI